MPAPTWGPTWRRRIGGGRATGWSRAARASCQPTVIDDAVTRTIDEISAARPAPQPAEPARHPRPPRQTFPDVPHVAVFDTAFHQTMPEAAYTYAIDANLARQYRIRRYGFHGTSHQLCRRAGRRHLLGIPFDEFNAIILHIGNGVSACAIRGGKSVDTSMGMTPLEGLVMGTRSRRHRPRHPVSPQPAGRNDGRPAGRPAQPPHRDARPDRQFATCATCRPPPGRGRTRPAGARHLLPSPAPHVGAYYALLDPLHAIVFTAGVGENSPWSAR